MNRIIKVLCGLAFALTCANVSAADYSSTRYSSDFSEEKTLYFESSKGMFSVRTGSSGYSPTGVPRIYSPLFIKRSEGSMPVPMPVVELLISQDIDLQIDELKEEIEELNSELSDQQAEVDSSGHDGQSFKLLSSIKRDLASKKKQLTRLSKEKGASSGRKLDSISSLLRSNVKRDLIVKDGNNYLRLRVAASKVDTPFKIPGKSISAALTEFIIVKKVNGITFEEMSVSETSYAKIYRKEGTLVGISYQGVMATLYKIQDQNLKKFSGFLVKHPVDVSRFDFKGQSLFTRYVTSNQDDKMRLDLEFSETGKAKNLVLVKAIAPTKLFDPESDSVKQEKHLGVLVPTKTQKLLQVKKVKKIGGQQDISWKFNLNSQMITLGNQAVIVSDELYYGYEGLWYLAYWMHQLVIDQLGVYLVNGTSPIALTVRQVGNSVVVSKENQDLFRYTFNNRGFIESFEFVPEAQTLRLASVETTTTIENKKLINDYMNKYGIEQL